MAGGSMPRGARVLLCGLAACGGSSGQDPAWSNGDLAAWRCRRPLLLTNPTAEELHQVPIPVRLDPGRFAGRLSHRDGADLRFTSWRGELLPHDVERWRDDGESIVWVRVPRVITGAETLLWLYRDPAGEPAPVDGAAVWSEYSAVWHLDPGATTAIRNAAGPQYEGEIDWDGAADGAVGRGLRFHGRGDQRIEMSASQPLFDGWEQFSIELWVYPEYPRDIDLELQEGGILDKGGPVRLGRLFRNGQGPGQGHVQFDLEFGGGRVEYFGADLPLRAWSYVVYSFDDVGLRVFRDGVAQDERLHTLKQLIRGDAPVVLGGGSPLHGILDEVRIARTGRRSAWVLMQDRAVRDTVLRWGDEECHPD